MYKITHFLFLLIFLIACKENKNNVYTPLEYTNSKIIDSLERNNFNKRLLSKLPFIPYKNYTYTIDYEENILYKYEVGKGKFEAIVNCNTPYRIVNYYIDKEEKYISCIIDNYVDELYILKVISLENNKVLLEKTIPEHSEYILSAFFNHILINQKDLYFSCMPRVINYPEGFTEKYIQMHWDIENNILEVLPIAYPKNYHGKYWGVNYGIDRVAINDSIHAFSYHFNDSIFLYNLNTKKIKAYYAGSHQPYIFPNIKFKDLPLYHEEFKMHIVYNAAMYFQMYYIENKGIYLRHFVNNKGEMSQLIYDKDFNYIGEFGDNVYKSFYSIENNYINFITKDSIILVEEYNFAPKQSIEIAKLDTFKVISIEEKYLKENYDAGVQKFLEKTKLIPAKNDSIIIYQSTHCASCVQSAALDFLKEKDNKNTSIIVFDKADKEMLANHIFLSPIVLCEDNSLTEEGYYHHMPHLYFWKGNKVTSSPIVKEKEEENI